MGRASTITTGLTETDRLTARPAPGRSLSTGLVVDASILARLLGLRLLRLEAHITFVPTEFASLSIGPAPQPYGPDGQECLSEAIGLLAHASRTLVEAGRERPGRVTWP